MAAHLDKSTLVPLGCVAAVLIAATLTTWNVRGYTNELEKAIERQEHATLRLNDTISRALTDIRDELQRRTKKRWDSDMESDAWRIFVRDLRAQGIEIESPDILEIKRRRDAQGY